MALDTMQMTASPGRREGLRILSLKGPLNIHTIFDFQNAVRAEDAQGLVVDMTAVPFVDSAGLGAMVGAVVNLQKAGRKIAFAAMNVQVEALVDMTHLNPVLRNFATVEDAESAVS
jgi:anti-sigma B factor antagonist